ncbi:hypothetical protein ACFPK5_39030 [Streptomyces beijiangensis]
MGWDATHTPADISGAYAYGAECWDGTNGHRIYAKAHLEDSASDGLSACLQIHADYSDGGTRDNWLYIGGKGNLTFQLYSYASNVRTIWVREGVGSGGVCTRMAGGVEVVGR